MCKFSLRKSGQAKSRPAQLLATAMLLKWCLEAARVKLLLGIKLVRMEKEGRNYTAKHSWLVPDIGGKGAFCKFCKKHYSGSRGLPKGSDGTFITKPFTKWSKATGSAAKNNKLLND